MAANLPPNGPEWHEIRSGVLKELKGLSQEFQRLLRQCMHPQASERPSTKDLLGHELLQSKLERALAQERKISSSLSHQLMQHKHGKRVAQIKGGGGESGLHRSLTM